MWAAILSIVGKMLEGIFSSILNATLDKEGESHVVKEASGNVYIPPSTVDRVLRVYGGTTEGNSDRVRKHGG